MKRVCVVTGSRADYGLLKKLIQNLKRSASVELKLAITGSHLSHVHGNTIDEISDSNVTNVKIIDVLLASDSREGVGNSVGLGVISFSNFFSEYIPDAVIVLGDRFEILAASLAAYIKGIAIIHLHGGETTEGSMDEGFRHAISKLSSFHFVASEVYRQRLIRMGESPERVFNVGALGVDAITNVDFYSRNEVEKLLGISLRSSNIVVTLHSVTTGKIDNHEAAVELVEALSKLRNVSIVFTSPNVDPGGREILAVIEAFVRTNKNAILVPSLGQRLYISVLHHFDAVVGNSSSGIIEAPYLKLPTVNIGNRQHGRLMASSIIQANVERGSIFRSVVSALSPEFKKALSDVYTPYGLGGASDRITKWIESKNFNASDMQKRFYDGV